MRTPDWQTPDGRVKLWCADCIDILLALPKVDCVVTDPPYGVGFSGKRAKQRNGDTLKAASGYIGYDDTTDNVRMKVVPAIVLAITLAKRAAITPGTRCMFMYPTPKDVGCFYSAAGTGLGPWGFVCSQPILYYGTCPHNHRGAKPNSMGQSYPNDANATGHPCSKPLPIALWLVERASLDGETILDPFMGSGTTGVACVRLGRQFLGIERDPKYFDIAVRRISREIEQGVLAFPEPERFEAAELFPATPPGPT